MSALCGYTPSNDWFRARVFVEQAVAVANGGFVEPERDVLPRVQACVFARDLERALDVLRDSADAEGLYGHPAEVDAFLAAIRALTDIGSLKLPGGIPKSVCVDLVAKTKQLFQFAYADQYLETRRDDVLHSDMYEYDEEREVYIFGDPDDDPENREEMTDEDIRAEIFVDLCDNVHVCYWRMSEVEVLGHLTFWPEQRRAGIDPVIEYPKANVDIL